MLLQPIWDWLVASVFNLPAVTGDPRPLFNPYRGVDPLVDQPEADLIRRENLRRYLDSFSLWPEALVIGEAPGWRGCRFSGIPFTSEAQLSGRLPFCGLHSNQGEQPLTEATATIFWRVMLHYHPIFLAWNCLPLHPHLSGWPLSNRTPSAEEIHLGGSLLGELAELLQPHLVIAVGASAQSALSRLGIPAIPIRHPAHGGGSAFQTGMHEIFYGLGNSPGSPVPAIRTIGYNSGTNLAPRVDHNPPL